MDSQAYQACKVELVAFDGFLRKGEDGEALDEPLESEIEASVLRLQSHLNAHLGWLAPSLSFAEIEFC